MFPLIRGHSHFGDASLLQWKPVIWPVSGLPMGDGLVSHSPSLGWLSCDVTSLLQGWLSSLLLRDNLLFRQDLSLIACKIKTRFKVNHFYILCKVRIIKTQEENVLIYTTGPRLRVCVSNFWPIPTPSSLPPSAAQQTVVFYSMGNRNFPLSWVCHCAESIK